MVSRNKLRLLYLYQYLVQHTDAVHPSSTVELINILKTQYGLSVSRNTISDDLNVLHDCGFRIEHYESTQNKYYYDGQAYSIAELKLLADAIASSKFITQRKSESLIVKLSTLTNVKSAAMLQRHIYVAGRVKSENECGYSSVDAINEAIHYKKKILFKYTELAEDRHRFISNNGSEYTVSPYTLIWDGAYYYVCGYCDECQTMRSFRLDRIESSLLILDEFAVMAPRDYDPANYRKAVFRMFETDEPIEVEIVCDISVMQYLIDNFGVDFITEPIDEKTFKAKVFVCTSAIFFRWVFGFDGLIKILSPNSVVLEYRQMLTRALED